MNDFIPYWFCENCGDELPWQKVTFDEKCATCGKPAEWITEDKMPVCPGCSDAAEGHAVRHAPPICS